MTTTATCTSSTTDQPAGSDALCLDTRPNTTVACNVDVPCPVYEWRAEHWQPCQAYCANGIQSRAINCFNVKPDPNLHLPAIKVDPSFCEAVNLVKPDTTQACFVRPASLCWGPQASLGIHNGRCDLSTGKCVCRTGTIGEDCHSSGSITSVQTNADQFTAGIPFHEPLTITWFSNFSSLPFVHIVLMKNTTGLGVGLGTEWSVGEYLGSNVLNSGYFQWQVGSKLPDLEVGNGYRVRVWFSKNLYQDSLSFSIADPCAYKSCGLNGNCQRGQCVCSAGFTGDACQTGPCDRANCAADSSTCTNIGVITAPPTMGPASGTPICACKDGFSGIQVSEEKKFFCGHI
jgi:hypothetical protein